MCHIQLPVKKVKPENIKFPSNWNNWQLGQWLEWYRPIETLQKIMRIHSIGTSAVIKQIDDCPVTQLPRNLNQKLKLS